MNITDKQIDEIFGISPFIVRNSMEKRGKIEIVEMTNWDWREVITDDLDHRGYFDTYDEAKVVAHRLHFRWLFPSENK